MGSGASSRRSPRPSRSCSPLAPSRAWEWLPRASKLQALSTENKTRFHLPDGPEQQARDARMATGSTDWAFKAVEWIYAHDARAL